MLTLALLGLRSRVLKEDLVEFPQPAGLHRPGVPFDVWLLIFSDDTWEFIY